MQRPTHRATFGPLLQAERKLYVIVSRHVTKNMASNSHITIKNGTSGEQIEIASVMKMKGGSESTRLRNACLERNCERNKSACIPAFRYDSDSDFSSGESDFVEIPNTRCSNMDIDVVRINPSVTKHVLKPSYYDTECHPRRAVLFEGDIHSILGKDVFQSSMRDGKRVIRKGKVSRLLKDSLLYFFVASNNLTSEPFAVAGDSGGWVAMVSENRNEIFLIGVILGGELKGSDACCLILNKGITYLQDKYKIKFKLLQDDQCTVGQPLIEPGYEFQFTVKYVPKPQEHRKLRDNIAFKMLVYFFWICLAWVIVFVH